MELEELNKRFNWGVVTPEFSNSETKEVLHIFNHKLDCVNLLPYNLSFITGRLKWYSLHLPEGTRQLVQIDDRGQFVKSDIKKQLRAELFGHCSSIEFITGKK